jgi:uncharacterized protein (DUF2384 family)
MFNLDLRQAIKSARLHGYEIAAALGIAETSFSRKMARGEMTTEEKERVFRAIERLKAAADEKEEE